MSPYSERDDGELDRIYAEAWKGDLAWPAARKVGRATAQFLPAVPSFWLEQCSALGMNVSVAVEGALNIFFDLTDPEVERAAVLKAWLLATPGGIDAVRALLEWRKRR